MSVASVPLLGMRFVAGFLLLALGPVLAFDALRALGVVADSPSVAEHMEGSMLAWLLTALLLFGFARLQPPVAPWRPWCARGVLATYVPFVAVWVLVLIGYLTVFALPPQPPLEYLAARQFERPGFWVVVAGIVVGAPVAEEVVFRGYLQGAMLGVMPRHFAIGLTAAVFGLVHSLPYALPVGLLGAFFGWLADRHQSLLPAVLAHAVHNGITVAVTVCWPETLDLLYHR